MNNNIQEPYCSFEVCKLLKEKGFDVSSPYWDFEEVGILSLRKPTHALVIEWIRINFGIHIFYDFGLGWEAFIIPVGYFGDGKFPSSLPNYKTPEEATEAALLYVLKNLI